MVDNLLLYKGPSRSDAGDYIVLMNETEDQLRFDVHFRSYFGNGNFSHAYVLKANAGRLVFHQIVDCQIKGEARPIKWEPFNIFSQLNEFIQDPSAHKVYRRSVFKMLRKYTKVDSFKTLVEPEKAISEAMYPMTKDIPLNNYTTLKILHDNPHKEYLRSLRRETVQEMTGTLFGKKRYRKDLVKAMAGANSVEFLTFLFTLKREIPVDWFISILRNNPELSHLPTEFSFDRLKEFYDSMSDKQFRKFCKCLMEEDHVPIQSILDMAAQFKECLEDETMEQVDSVTKIKFRNLEEFHYWIGKHHEATNKERERRELIEKYGGEITGNKYYEALREIDFSSANYEVIIPTCAYELVEWGSEMSNCIGGYATRAQDSPTDAYVALKSKNGTMKANILMADRNISQFFGKRNSQADPKIAYDFNMRLILNGFIERKSDLYGTHFRAITKATGFESIDAIKNDFNALGVSVDEYIALRRP